MRGSDALFLSFGFASCTEGAYAAWLWTSGEARYRLYYFLPQTRRPRPASGASLGPWLWRQGSLAAAARAASLSSWWWAHRAPVHQPAAVAAGGRRPAPGASRYIYGWVAEHLPHDACAGSAGRGAAWDWFAPQRVVNLDGLINDAELVAVLRDGREPTTARSHIRTC
jgi:hypothetical protein